MKHCLLLLLYALIVDASAFADGTTTKESSAQEIPRQTQSHENRRNGEDTIAPGHVPANIYDALPRPREIQIIDARPIIRDFRTAPTGPGVLAVPQRNALGRTNALLFDALPSPNRHSHLKGGTPLSAPQADRKGRSGWLPVADKHASKTPPILKH